MTEIYMGAAQRSSEGDVSALDTRVTALEGYCGDATLTTTAQTLGGAVNELDNDLSHCAIRSYHSNSALTVDSGKVTWTILTPRAPYVVCAFYITASGEEFIPAKITHTSNSIVVEIDSESDVAGDTYTAVLVG